MIAVGIDDPGSLIITARIVFTEKHEFVLRIPNGPNFLYCFRIGYLGPVPGIDVPPIHAIAPGITTQIFRSPVRRTAVGFNIVDIVP